MSARHDLTHHLLTLLPDCYETPESALNTWWYDARAKGGLRLTDHGFEMLVDVLKLDCHTFELGMDVMTPRNLLALDRYLTCPYYLRRRRVQGQLILFGDREAVVANLYGDVEKFISSLVP